MLASKYADPQAEPLKPSRRKRSRADDVSAPSLASPDAVLDEKPTSTSLSSPKPDASPASAGVEGSQQPRRSPTNEAGDSTLASDQGTRSVSPLPHVAEFTKNDNIPAPTVVLSRSPSPAPKVDPKEETNERNGTLQVEKDATEITLGVAPPASTASPDTLVRNGTPASAGSKRLRSQRGKMCSLKLPHDPDKSFWRSPMPLTKKEVDERFRAFEEAGFDTRGYGFAGQETEGDDVGSQSHSCAEYPNAQEKHRDYSQGSSYKITIPVKQDWDDYVGYLREEKLRQLGVSLGDEPIPPPPLSRQGSSQYPQLAFSPPPPGSSAASQHHWQNMVPFSAPFSPGGSTNNTSMGPMASPPPFAQPVRPGHLSRQSTFSFQFPGGPAGGMQQQLPPQRGFTPDAVNRGFSPASTAGSQKPLPRLPSEAGSIPRRQASTSLAESQTAQPDGGSHPLEDPSNKAPAQAGQQQFVDLASPKPQGHRHNISESLEREAENAMYYPGEYVNEDSDSSKKGGPAQPDWGSLGASRKSAVEEPNQGHKTVPSHASNASTQLNVDAKEFKFDPAKSHNRNFSMSNDALMPSASNRTAAKPADATSSVSLTTAHSNQGAVSLSNFNVAAPEFKPPAQKNFAFSSSWFNFSKKPTEQANKPEPEKVEEVEDKKPAENTTSKIFGGLSNIIKPGKKSKAIPIVNPESIGIASTKDNSDAEQEDADGRPERDATRGKRSRRFDADADEVPRFAEPTPEPEPASNNSVLFPQRPAESLGRKTSQTELSRPRSEDLSLPNRPRPLKLEYELDVNGELSDSSNVPWHGVDDSQEKPSEREANEPGLVPMLANSPAPSPRIEEVPTPDQSSRSAALDSGRQELSHSDKEQPDRDEKLYSSFNGVDDLTAYINDDNSDFGVGDEKHALRDIPTLHPNASASSIQQANNAPRNLLSPSPTRYQRLSGNSMADEAENRQQPNQPSLRGSLSPVRRLNRMGEAAPVSDWDDMLSSGEEPKILQQHQLSDAHIAGIVEGLLKRHLGPFQRTLKDLGTSLNRKEGLESSRVSRPRSSYEQSSSDADDESETEDDRTMRTRDVKSERRMSQIRSAVKEAMGSNHSGAVGLVEQETKLRKAAEHRVEEVQRLLTITEKEVALYKENTANQDDRARSLEDEREDALGQYRHVEEELRSKTLAFTSEVAKLENDLDDYRASSAKWQDEIDSVKKSREHLHRTIDSMKQDAAEHTGIRQELLKNVSSTEEEFKAASREYTADRHDWQRKDEKHSRDIQNLQTQVAEANDLKQKLGAEIDSLSSKEKEATKNAIRSNVMLEETQKAKSSLEAQVSKLNDKAVEHSTIVARYEREASEANENTAIEVQRTRSLLQTDIEIANKKVENVKADLETRLEMTRSELDNVRKDHDAVRGRYERSLNESVASRKEAVQEANNVHAQRLEEERQRFNKALKEVSEQHDRAMRNAHEDKQRSETHLSSQLKLSDAKVAHLEDKTSHLDDRLSIAQSAAQAAAAAAQSAKSVPATSEGAVTSSRSIATPAHLDKVSPQALRESVVVLQEQLQEREARIERLEAKDSSSSESPSADTSSRLQEKEAEVSWLREILTVRLDDLTDLISNLQLERFDRGAARNAAIRIKANLQMEQQERERHTDPSKRNATSPNPAAAIPTFSDIQSFASPKAAQIAAAWGNWRRNPPTLAGMREAQNAGTPSKPSSSNRPQQTRSGSQEMTASTRNANSDSPSTSAGFRPTNPVAAAAASNANSSNNSTFNMAASARSAEVDSTSYFTNATSTSTSNQETQPDKAWDEKHKHAHRPSYALPSGLMTPPASNLRRTPSMTASAPPANVSASSPPKVSGPNSARPRTPSRSMSRSDGLTGSPEKAVSKDSGSTTPEFLRSGGYDLDAELGSEEIDGEAHGEVGSEDDNLEAELGAIRSGAQEESTEKRLEQESPSKVKSKRRMDATMDATEVEPLGGVVAEA